VPLPIEPANQALDRFPEERRRRIAGRPKAVYIPDDPLLKPGEAAEEVCRAPSTFWRDVRNGKLPAPIYLGPRMPRWRCSELRASVDACPRGKPTA
jgi:predicted DNA-binding transcriptional regulator AlpA